MSISPEPSGSKSVGMEHLRAHSGDELPLLQQEGTMARQIAVHRVVGGRSRKASASNRNVKVQPVQVHLDEKRALF